MERAQQKPKFFETRHYLGDGSGKVMVHLWSKLGTAKVALLECIALVDALMDIAIWVPTVKVIPKQAWDNMQLLCKALS